MAYQYGATVAVPVGFADSKSASKEDALQVAHVFTVGILCLYAAPTILTAHLGWDLDVAYWAGRWGLFALCVPVLLLLQHWVHGMMIQRNARKKNIFLWASVLPAIFFMIVGGSYMSEANYLYGQLKSNDCSGAGGLPMKSKLQQAYAEAHAIFETCNNRLIAENGGAPLMWRPTLQSCQEWTGVNVTEQERVAYQGQVQPWTPVRLAGGLAHHWSPEYNYLAAAEVNHLCGGFCVAGPMLWTAMDETGRMGGSCSQYIAHKFLVVKHWGWVILVVSGMIIAVSGGIFFAAKPTLTSLGYK